MVKRKILNKNSINQVDKKNNWEDFFKNLSL
jgi:hypothetical protein